MLQTKSTQLLFHVPSKNISGVGLQNQRMHLLTTMMNKCPRESWNIVLTDFLTRSVEGTYRPAISPEKPVSPLLHFSLLTKEVLFFIMSVIEELQIL